MANPKRRRQARRVGDVLLIELGEGRIAYARVLTDSCLAFYACHVPEEDIEKIVGSEIMFIIPVEHHPIKSGEWTVIGNVPLEENLKRNPVFFREDSISGAIDGYDNGVFVPLSREDAEKLERASVWARENVEERLNAVLQGKESIFEKHSRLGR